MRWRVWRAKDLELRDLAVIVSDGYLLGFMVEINNGWVRLEEIHAALRVFHPLIVEVTPILLIEFHIAGDIVVPTNDDFDLEF